MPHAPRHAINSVPHLSQLGGLLRASLERTVTIYSDCLRKDPVIPHGDTMSTALLEDHAVSMISDLAQSLVIVGEAGQEATDLLRDGSAIQRTIAEQHGRRRHAQGWLLEAVQRDNVLLQSCVQQTLREVDAQFEGSDAMGVLIGMLDRAGEISSRAWRQAEMRGDLD
jgi:hypothetical protein